MATAEPRMDFRFVCKTCGKGYKSASGLSAHERTHAGNAPYRCCGKLFFSKANITRHRCSKHKEEMQFVCHCGSKFAVGADLRAHQKVHGSAAYTCDICNTSIHRKKQFEDHMAMHRGEKNYVCPCGKRFTHRPNLTQHSKRCQQKK